MSEGYQGLATLRGAEVEIAVRITLSGHVDPLDGRFHWGGRIGPDARVVGLVRAGKREVTLQVADAQPLPARLTEVDPWGGVILTATGRPPWPAPTAPTA